MVVGDINSPTAQVKITNDITLGFINNKNDFKYAKLFPKIDRLFKILLVTFTRR